MKLAQCITGFIFPTENHLVIASAHERKAPGHLKVEHISSLTVHFPFSNTGVKSLIFLSTSLCYINPNLPPHPPTPNPLPTPPPPDLFLHSLFPSVWVSAAQLNF